MYMFVETIKGRKKLSTYFLPLSNHINRAIMAHFLQLHLIGNYVAELNAHFYALNYE